jgi:DNA-binding CsgD family transcriptional regulator/pimeloyl-ACP methyl ester carboxylesterase
MMPAPFNHVHLMWRVEPNPTLIQPLAARYRLVQYDSRGQGMSTRGLTEFHKIDDYLLDLATVVGKVGLSRFVLAGGPLFANVAARYALAHPEHLLGLILIDEGPGDAWGGADGMGRFEEQARTNWRSYLGWLAGGMMADPERVRYYDQAITQADFLTVLGAIRGSSIEGSLGGLTVPTLVIGGHTATTDIFVENAKRLAAAVPDARLAIFDDWPWHLYSRDGSTPPAIPAIESFIGSLQGVSDSERVEAVDSRQAAARGLSSREVEVLRLLAAGKSNAQIADELVISQNTVIRHVSNIFAKTGAANRAQATAYAKDNGIA